MEKKDRDFYFDELGNEIHEGDLLKIYHFRGRRRRKHYMYQIAIKQESNGGIWWAGKDYHRSENKGHYWLLAVANKETGVLHGYQVIARKNYEEKDLKIR